GCAPSHKVVDKAKSDTAPHFAQAHKRDPVQQSRRKCEGATGSLAIVVSDRGPSHPCGVTPRIAIASDAPRGAASRHLQPASSAERLRNEGDDQPETAQPTDDRDSDLRAWLHCGLPG